MVIQLWEFLSGGQLSHQISLLRGVKQGLVLSPFIFNSPIITATQYIPPYVIDGIDVSHLLYADDILLFSDNLISIQNAINRLHSHLQEIGLEIEPTKTEFLVVNNNRNFQHRSIRVGSSVLGKLIACWSGWKVVSINKHLL